MDSAYRGALQAALDAGVAVLGDGKGSALDAVCAVVCSLEDSPLFNAGRGSVFTDAGECEMEASVRGPVCCVAVGPLLCPINPCPACGASL
jgi:beta-aspartyl-peptidase (threonine type)